MTAPGGRRSVRCRTVRRARGVIGAVAIAVTIAACAGNGGPVAKSASQDSRAPASVPVTDPDEPSAPPPTVGGTQPAPGAAGAVSDPDGIGDELLPPLGNPGLDVQHYDVDLTYDHADTTVRATVAIDLRLTEDREEITLDADGPEIDAVRVDGVDATFTQEDVELRIELPQPGRTGDDLRVEVDYHFTGNRLSNQTGLPVGWFNTAGGSYVLNEPDGARTWLPSNDHPSDKATFTFTIHVGSGVTAVANGELVSQSTTDDGGATWVWRQDEPMATYLVQLLTGDYELIDGATPDGVPLTSAVLRSELPQMQPLVDDIDEEIAYFEQFFGPFPLDRYGIAITDSSRGLAMETQGRSLFSRDDLSGDPRGSDHVVLSHELAHQWFGDAVSPARWQDIWLNESFATYGEWMYGEHVGFRTVQDQADAALADRPPGVTADPTLSEMFGFDVYQGGAVALHALRLTIGDDAFFDLLRQWVARNDGTSRTTEDFIALAEKVSGQDLTEFFDDWIFSAEVPRSFPTPAPTPSSTPPLVTIGS